MEANWRAVAITAVAPIAWASTYPVIRHLLPADEPLTTALIRALPAGLLLLLIARRAPHGHWWWRAVVLGALNFAGFFALTTVAAHLLPSSVATVVTTAGPVFIILLAWAILRERPTLAALAGAGLGVIGVVMLVGGATGAIDPLGVAASVGGMLLSSIGAILARRWSDGTSVVATTSWQLIAGGLMLLPAALIVEGVPAAPTPLQLGAYAWLSVVATALAFLAWFSGLRALPAQRVGLVGLLNPLTGVLLGTLIAGEHLAVPQWIAVGVVLAGVIVGQLGRRGVGRRGATSAEHDLDTEPGRGDGEQGEHRRGDDVGALAAACVHGDGAHHDDGEPRPRER